MFVLARENQQRISSPPFSQLLPVGLKWKRFIVSPIDLKVCWSWLVWTFYVYRFMVRTETSCKRLSTM